MDQPIASYKGSPKTFELVRKQIAERFGDAAADSFSPLENCFTLRTWNSRGFKIKRGEKAFTSYTFICDDDLGNRKKWRRPVWLFFHTQVEPIKS